MLEGLAGGLNAEFEDEGLGADAEGFDKFPMELTDGEVDLFGEFLDGDLVAEVLSNVGNGLIELEEGLQEGLAVFVSVGGAHETDNVSKLVTEGEFVGDVPIGDALSIEEELYEVEAWFAGGENGLIVAAKGFCEAFGEEVEVVAADNFLFALEAEAFVEKAAGAENTTALVFGEEGDVGEVIKEAIEWGCRVDGSEELLSPERTVRGWGEVALGGARHKTFGCEVNDLSKNNLWWVVFLFSLRVCAFFSRA